MMSPGQFVSLKLTEGNPNDEFIQFDITNDCLDTSFIRSPLTTTISEQYQRILTFKALPLKQLTQQQQQELANDQQTIANLRDAYRQYQVVTQSAQANYQVALTNLNIDPLILQQLLNAYQDAQQQWDTAGQRQAYENALADSLYLQSGDPRAYFNTLAQKLTQFHPLPAHRGDYFKTTFEPAVAEWPDASWTHAVLDTSTMSSSSYSRSTQWSGGFSAAWGLWSFGGGGGHSETYNHNHSTATKLVADLEYLRVKISRPWLVSDVFTDRFWTWLASHGFSYLSDGGISSANPPVRPIGTMPFFPSEMVVVRKVKLTADFSETDNQTITQHNQGGSSFGFGPFSISGSYSEDSTEVNTSATVNGATVEIDQPQIIAFLGALMPQCPNPDPTLPWQSDAALPHAASASASG